MTNTHESVCNRTLRNLDAFLDGELDEQAASAIRRHVDECMACASELDLRSSLSKRLKSAASSDSASPFLQTRVLANLRRHERPAPSWLQRSAWVSAAALAVLAVGLTVSYQLGNLRFTVAAQNRYLDAMIQKVAFGMRPGLSDHIHCAVFRKYRSEPPSIEKLRSDLGPEYGALLDLAKANMPPDFSVRIAHECRFRGRAFVHLALKSDSNLASLVLTRRREGESLAANDLAPVISRGGVNLYGASAQRFQMSGFETATHFAYFISDMTPADTHRILLAMTPELRAIIAKLPA